MKMLKKPVLMMVIALLTISFAMVSVSQAAEVKGTIVSINPDIGTVGVQDQVGKLQTLTAGPEIDLKAFKKGDQVIIEYDKDMIIVSISKKG
ncbi:MAG: hypothetical protein U9R43_09125 [Thermodesulfobacteriota bacterium]|nr:hypothetical protein [Thermodesulfobacteriota bacterium]